MQNTRLIMTGIFSGLFLAALDQTIVATALPTIIKELHGIYLYAWAATIYLLTITVSLPVFGRLMEIYDSKKILLLVIIIFLTGSVLSGFSESMKFLIFARAIQGVGAGGLFSITLSIVGIIFSPRERGKFQGYFGAVYGISSVAGPFLGGFITETISWHWVFFVNVPIGIASIYFISRYMPSLKPPKMCCFDIWGTLLMILWSTSLILVLSLTGHQYTIFSPVILSIIGFSLLTFVLFVLVEIYTPDPLFELTLLNNSTTRKVYLALFCFGSVFITAVLFMPLYFVQVRGMSNIEAGFALIPLTLGVVTASTLAGLLVTLIGRYKTILIITNSWLLIWLLVLSYILSPVVSFVWVCVVMFLIGIGMGPALPLFTTAVQNTVTRERMGTVSSGSQFFRQIGASVGTAIMGSLLSSNLKTFGNTDMGSIPGAVSSTNGGAVVDAIVKSVSDIMKTNAILVAITLLITLLLPDIVLKDKKP